MNTPLLILAAVFLSLLAHAADPLSEALQRGLLAEESQRDLAEASAAYQEAVRLGDAQRLVVATALFRLAEIERRQGRTQEALVYYQRLVREHPDATHLTVLAQRHLPPGAGASNPEAMAVISRDLDQSVARWGRLREQRRRFATMTNDPVTLGRTLSVDYSTPQLARLMTDLNQAEVRKAELTVTYGPKHPLRVEAEAVLSSLRQGIAAENDAILESLKARDTELETLVTTQRETLGRLAAAGPAGISPGAPVSEAHRLLDEEIALAEQQLDVVKRRQQVGRADTEEVLKASREVLALKRQRVAMPDLPVIPAAAAPEAGNEEDREIARLQRMLANSPDLLNAPQGSDNETPLQTATRQDQARVVEYLLNAGADINALGGSGITALSTAALAGHKRMVDLLLRAGAKVDARGPGNITPLLVAVARERTQVVQTLLAAGASPTIQCGSGGVSTRLGGKSQISPLGLAVLLQNRALVEQMARGGADLNAPGLQSQSPLENARIRGDWDMVSLLLDLGADLDPGPKAAQGTFLEALVRSSAVPTSILDQVLARGGRLDVTNASGDTLLNLAIQARATHAVSWLLAHGVEPDPVNRNGLSPVMNLVSLFTVRDRPPEELQALERQLDALLALKVNVNRASPQSGAPLGWLVWSGNTNVFQRLLAAGADPNSVSPEGIPLLWVLARFHHQYPDDEGFKTIALANARALLLAGANPNVEWTGTTPLNVALESSPEMVQLLLDFKADPNRRNGSGRTALEHLAVVRAASGSGLPSKEALVQIEAALRAAGARENVPDFGIIRLVRPSQGFAQVIFRRNGTHDANRYTLLEALAVHYGLVLAPRVALDAPRAATAAPSVSGGPVVIARGGVGLGAQPGVAVGRNLAPGIPRHPPPAVRISPESGLQFPDWKGVVIRRPEPDGARWTEIPVDVAEIFAEGGCGRDVVLKWGDVIEVPERDHPVGEEGSTVPSELLDACQDCLARSVTFTVGGKSEPRRQALGRTKTGGFQTRQDPFTLEGALSASRLVRTSSDTSRVILRRPDPATGKTTETLINCRDPDGEGGTFWLRDGDEIVVPDLR